MVKLPEEIDDRRTLHEDIHARPPPELACDSHVLHIAILHRGINIQVEHEHLKLFCEKEGLEFKQLDPGFVRLQGSSRRLWWERHGEFSRYALTQNLAPHVDPFAFQELAQSDWLARLPGQLISAVQLVVLRDAGNSEKGADSESTLTQARQWMHSPSLSGSLTNRGNGRCFADFKLREDGTVRMLILDRGMGDASLGRVSTGLLEMETYRILALRGFLAARRLMPKLARIESRLEALTQALRSGQRDDASLLEELTLLAGEVEHEVVSATASFSSARAFHGIVMQRLQDHLGEAVGGLRSIQRTIERRQLPAMATVEAAETRLDRISERVARASALLQARVNIQTEQQNQDLLRSLGKGQAMQLRLQQTVEGLSIAAITYYVVGLIEKLAKFAQEQGSGIPANWVAAISIPMVALFLWWLLKRVRHAIHQ